jgi:hypothetical protein
MAAIHKLLAVTLATTVLFALSTVFVSAGERVLSNNTGDASAAWVITGEPTLVINGFDLTPLGLRFPATIDKVSISVDTPVQGAVTEVVVYQDANGGTPADATLAGQAQATITQAGVFTFIFPTPVTISQPVVWVGFYLPVDFKFLADRSGTSVLTYWAWTPGGRFDLTRLSSAQILGPSNGTAPVNLDLKGIARITAEISSSGFVPGGPTTVPVTVAAGTLVPGASSTQIPSTSNTNLNVLQVYPPACDTLFWDTADVGVTYRGSIEPRCAAIWPGYAPANPLGYVRKQMYYDLTFFNSKGQPISDPLPYPVTHCIQPSPEDINNAIIGIASGSPRVFKILPTLRVGNLVCAEVDRSGGVSYFVPG